MKTIVLTKRDKFYKTIYSMIDFLEKRGYAIDDRTFDSN